MPLGRGRGPAQDAPTPTVGDPPQLLDVKADKLAGSLPLVADNGGSPGSDHASGHRGAVVKPRLPVADSTRCPPCVARSPIRADPVRPAALLPTQPSTSCSTCAAVRSGTSAGDWTGHAGRPRPRRHTDRSMSSRTCERSPSPPRCGHISTATGDCGRSAADRGRQTGITMEHENLRRVGLRQATAAPGLSSGQDSRAVSNLLAGYT